MGMVTLSAQCLIILERVKNEYMRKNNEQVLYPFNFSSGYQVTFVETVCR